MACLLVISVMFNLFLLYSYMKEKKQKPILVEKEKNSGLNKKVAEQIRQLYLAYRNSMDIEDLKEVNKLTVEKNKKEWNVYESMCYYGGCLFDKVTFKTEYEAYRHAAVLSLLKELKRNIDESPVSVKVADVNYLCERFRECSGIE